MNLPPKAPIPQDPPGADPVEHRLQQTAPVPVNAALMARLRLARPDMGASAETVPVPIPAAAPSFTSGSSEFVSMSAITAGPAAPVSSPAVRARRRVIPFPDRGYWSAGAAAAALILCGWAGWKAAAPAPGNLAGVKDGAAPRTESSPGNSAAPADGDESLEFLPALESRQHLLSVKDLGVFRDSRQRPVQLMSATWLDENTYGSTLDPELRESRVRHEIVPVVLPTY